MGTKVKAKPKEGLILHKIEPNLGRVNCSVVIDPSSDISLCFKVDNGFDPTPYLNEALAQGLDNKGNLMYLLFTNKVKPSNGLDLPHCYLVSPNGNFFYGISIDGALIPLTHALGEIHFLVDKEAVREKENSFPDKKPYVNKKFPHAYETIYRIRRFDHVPETEVILPVHFHRTQHKEVIDLLKRVDKDMNQRGYKKKHYFIMLVPRAGELQGVEGRFDASFFYSAIDNSIGININPREGLGGVREAALETKIQKCKEYLTPFFNFVN